MTHENEGPRRLGMRMTAGFVWTVGCGLVGAGLYIGLNMATITTRLDEMNRVNISAASERIKLDGRVRNLETEVGQNSVRFTTLYQMLQDLKSQQRENNALLRQILREGGENR